MTNFDKKLAIGCDHAGYIMKEKIKAYLVSKGYELVDYGTHSETGTDYPDYAHQVALAVESGSCSFGIVLCGSGNGVNMTANKHQGIRSAICWMPELARLARLHNDANVLALPARFIDESMAKEITDAFFSHSFEGGRHCERVNKIPFNPK